MSEHWIIIQGIAEIIMDSKITKLSEKEAANALSPNGDADTVVNAQDLQALKDRASRSKSPHDIAAYMTAKKRAK